MKKHKFIYIQNFFILEESEAKKQTIKVPNEVTVKLQQEIKISYIPFKRKKKKEVMQFLKKLKITIRSRSSTSEYIFRRIKRRVTKRYLYAYFTATLYTIAKRWKQTRIH